MLYIIVNKEQDRVYYATYDKVKFGSYYSIHPVKLIAVYWNEVSIQEVIE